MKENKWAQERENQKILIMTKLCPNFPYAQSHESYQLPRSWEWQLVTHCPQAHLMSICEVFSESLSIYPSFQISDL